MWVGWEDVDMHVNMQSCLRQGQPLLTHPFSTPMPAVSHTQHTQSSQTTYPQPSSFFTTLPAFSHTPISNKTHTLTGREDLAREALRGLQLVQPHPMTWTGLGLILEGKGELALYLSSSYRVYVYVYVWRRRVRDDLVVGVRQTHTLPITTITNNNTPPYHNRPPAPGTRGLPRRFRGGGPPGGAARPGLLCGRVGAALLPPFLLPLIRGGRRATRAIHLARGGREGKGRDVGGGDGPCVDGVGPAAGARAGGGVARGVVADVWAVSCEEDGGKKGLGFNCSTHT